MSGSEDQIGEGENQMKVILFQLYKCLRDPRNTRLYVKALFRLPVGMKR